MILFLFVLYLGAGFSTLFFLRCFDSELTKNMFTTEDYVFSVLLWPLVLCISIARGFGHLVHAAGEYLVERADQIKKRNLREDKNKTA